MNVKNYSTEMTNFTQKTGGLFIHYKLRISK